ncbi:MAG: hypothetical protein AAFY48_12670, partial [Bacteroidota bacterium]
MKNDYALLFLCLTFLSVSIYAQSTVQHRVTGGLTNTTLHLDIRQETRVISPGAIGPGFFGTSDHLVSRGIGFNLGYQGQIHDRWEIAVRASYMGNTIQDNADNFASRSILTPDLIDRLQHTRSYRGLWFEGLLFWRLVGPYVRGD